MDISIIVPVVERYDDLRKLYSEFASAFDKLDKSYEFIFVVDDLHRLNQWISNACSQKIEQP